MVAEKRKRKKRRERSRRNKKKKKTTKRGKSKESTFILPLLSNRCHLLSSLPLGLLFLRFRSLHLFRLPVPRYHLALHFFLLAPSLLPLRQFLRITVRSHLDGLFPLYFPRPS
jgi:hypothetical protein